MAELSIINSKVVNEGKVQELDVYIKDGRIENISDGLETKGEVIDASGLYLLPGVIDDQVHFREPGLTERGDINSESRAAVAGGTTSFMDMPNVIPPTLNHDLWTKKNEIAKKNSLANFSFYMGSSNNNIEEIKKINPKEVCGVKVFMGSSTGNLLVDDESALENIFKFSPVLITTHCEHTPSITENEKKALKEHGTKIPMHLHETIRSREACMLSTEKAIDLANRNDADLHVLHVSTEDEAKRFYLEHEIKGQPSFEDKRITCEVCIPHLFFCSKDYKSKGSLIKCNPSIKDESDKKWLRKALKQGSIDYVATDHAPHLLSQKQNDYPDCPSGMPSVQHSLLTVLEMVHEGDLELTDVPRVTSHNVAKRFQIKKRGFIEQGYWADLVLVDMNKSQEDKRENLFYKCGWSPFEGYTFKSTIIETIVNGERVFRDGKIMSIKNGKKLEFTRG